MAQLFDISKTDKGISVIMPGAINLQTGYMVGTTEIEYPTMQDAKDAIIASREEMRVRSEMRSLGKYFSDERKIETVETEQGTKYDVTVSDHAGLSTSFNGKEVLLSGRHSVRFDSWDAAKAKFFESLDKSFRPQDGNLLTLSVSDKETMAFSDFSAFDPKESPTQEIYDIPDAVKKYLGYEGEDTLQPSQHSYEKTLEDKDWKSKLYSFIKDYLSKEGAHIKDELGIEALDTLTPKQASALSSRIVLELTDYNTTDKAAQGETHADQSTVLEILKEGRKEKDNPLWNGNGVCRNFGCAVKGVFESLKANQTGFSLLNNTYCQYSGEDGKSNGSTSFKPKRDDFNSISKKTSQGHAWNTFFTVSKTGQIDASIIDVTWVDRNLAGMSQIERLDRTTTRLLPIVCAISNDIDPNSNIYSAQVSAIALYYADRLENLSERKDEFGVNEREAVVSSALTFGGAQSNFYDFPKPFVDSVLEGCLQIAPQLEKDEVQSLHHISQSSPWADFNGVLSTYLKDKRVSDFGNYVTFKDDDLQRQAFEILRARDGFEENVKNEPKLYGRMMAVYPQLYYDFNPSKNICDAKALSEMLERSNGLRKHNRSFGGGTPTPNKIEKVVNAARDMLRNIDPEEYAEHVEDMNDFYLIANFDAFEKELKSNCPENKRSFPELHA